MPNGGSDCCGGVRFHRTACPRRGPTFSRAKRGRAQSGGWRSAGRSTPTARTSTRAHAPQTVPSSPASTSSGRLPWHGAVEVDYNRGDDGPCEVCGGAHAPSWPWRPGESGSSTAGPSTTWNGGERCTLARARSIRGPSTMRCSMGVGVPAGETRHAASASAWCGGCIVDRGSAPRFNTRGCSLPTADQSLRRGQH